MQSVLVLGYIKMLPVKFLVALAAVYNSTLYVLRPPECIDASIAYNRTNATWHKMGNDSLTDIPVFKVSVKNFKDIDVLPFKIKFHYPEYVIDTTWQSVSLKHTRDPVSAPLPVNDCGCYVSLIIIATSVLLVATTYLGYLTYVYCFVRRIPLNHV